MLGGCPGPCNKHWYVPVTRNKLGTEAQRISDVYQCKRWCLKEAKLYSENIGYVNTSTCMCCLWQLIGLWMELTVDLPLYVECSRWTVCYISMSLSNSAWLMVVTSHLLLIAHRIVLSEWRKTLLYIKFNYMHIW